MIAHRPPAASAARRPRCHATALAKRACSLHPAVERARLDQQQLAARHNLHERLHVALEVRDAHAQRCGRLCPGEQPARHGLDRTIPRSSRHPGDRLGRQTTRRTSALVKSDERIDRSRECRPYIGQGLPARSASQLSRPASPTPACHPLPQPEDVDGHARRRTPRCSRARRTPPAA